ncbi:GNAT family N-acetyltransferase [Hugenholtzia roseola]|uniref:GNAT family N-acetyltransferase n=1 Tax=Hugenholtzia roseola TaxID=1002 RepID=UPI00040203E4|nr:GNAT family N-acetyltransferase [Hugenholtzia roseola]
MQNPTFEIRQARPQDVPAAFALIEELALFEKAPHAVSNTPEEMLRDGFGQNPAFGMLVAESQGALVGISIYYVRYSTWKGRCLYLEDLVVTEKVRGKGIGKALFAATARKAQELEVKMMVWQVLDWNTPAIEFYKSWGAVIDTGWYNCRLEEATLYKI